MSLLKLTYIAHGWHLEMRGQPLFPNRIEAWQYGPVIPDVYRDFRRQGINVQGPVGTVLNAPIAPDDEHLLEQIYASYGNLAPFQLSDITHVPGGPWDIATQTGGYYAPIPDDLIRQHYVAKRLEAEKHAANA
ncbi:Panacea domain-containing protein [Pseudooceanicola atlanticus]|uniref:Panacea domain-containing protein n=1 Tax=Pseudooceanicola atlanticus TaxID=1461694 RepID=UPI002357B193|nr:type II toxin-antitoxin system antitoxin SocA domain-containing protein [Pseudooceanicola atlanticus]